jgi:hypothetical protein
MVQKESASARKDFQNHLTVHSLAAVIDVRHIEEERPKHNVRLEIKFGFRRRKYIRTITPLKMPSNNGPFLSTK